MTIQSDIRAAIYGVVVKHAKDRLQPVYKSLLDDLGIPSGDISPMESLVLENAESAWGAATASWLVNSLSFDQAEAMGMDGTLRT
jgi:hypothetical protein